MHTRAIAVFAVCTNGPSSRFALLRMTATDDAEESVLERSVEYLDGFTFFTVYTDGKRSPSPTIE